MGGAEGGAEGGIDYFSGPLGAGHSFRIQDAKGQIS